METSGLRRVLDGQTHALDLAVKGQPLTAVLKILVCAATEGRTDDARAAVFTMDAEGRYLRCAAASGMSPDYTEAFLVSPESPSCGKAAHRGQVVIVPDVSQDPLWTPYLALARQHHIQACWSFPISTSDGPVLGTFALYRGRTGAPDAEDLECLQILANTAALFIDRQQHIEQRIVAEAALHERVEDCRRAEQSLLELRQERQQAEQAFHEERTRLHAVLQHLPQGVIIAEAPSGRLLLGNKQVEKICRHDFIASSIDQYDGYKAFHGDGRPYLPHEWPLARTIAAGDLITNEEVRIQRGDGSFGWLEVTSAPIREADGRIVAGVVTFTDISDHKQANEQLQQSETRLRAMFNQAAVGMVLVDKTGRLLEVNDRMCEIVGRQRDELVQLSCERLTHPDDWRCNAAMIQEVLAGARSSFDIEKRYGRPDGSWVWVHLSVSPIRNDTGAIDQLMAVVADITPRKDAEAKLKDKEAQLQGIYQNAAIGLAQVGLDGRWLYVNKTLCRITGYSEDELLATTVFAITHLEDLKQGQSLMKKLADGTLSNYTVDKRYCRKDGSSVWVSLTVSMQPASGGRPQYYIGGIVDITKQKQAEEALRQSEERFSKAFAASPDGLVISGEADGVIREVNDSFLHLFGLQREQAIGRRSTELGLIDEKDRTTVIDALHREGRLHELEIQIGRRSPTAQWALLSVERIEMAGERLLLTIIRDISVRKGAEEELARAKALINEVLARAPVGIAYFDRDLRYVLINERLAEMNGLPVAAHMGKRLHDIVPSLASAAEQVVARILQTGQPIKDQESVGETPAHPGMARYWNETWYPVRDPQGHITGFGAIVEEITARKQAELALRASEERLRLALDGAQIGMWSTNPHSGVTDCTALNKVLFGLDPAIPSITTEEWLALIHPHDRDRLLATWNRTLHEGAPYALEYRIVRPDGTVRWMDSRGRFQQDRRGETRRVVGITMDITDRRRAEKALRESEERLAGIMTTAMDAIISVDQEQRITLFNRAAEQLFECPAEQALGQPIEWFIPARYRHAHDQHIRDFGATGVTSLRMGRFGTVYGLRASGKEFPLEASISQLEVNGEKLYTVILRDITERQEQEDALRRWKDQLEQRVAERTRELTSSQDRLRALGTELNLAEQRERKRLATELHDHLQQLLVLGKLKVGQGKRLADLTPAHADVMQQIDHVLSEALTYTRTLVTELSPPVLREHGLSAALKWLGDYMKRHDMAVDVTVPASVRLEIPEDQAVLLFQSVRELLINAAKHSGTSQAFVRLREQAQRLVIDVMDKGRGFDPTALRSAASLDNTPQVSSQFGLFSIGERMRALGGVFTLESSPGQGTTATLILPLHCKTLPQTGPHLGTRKPLATRSTASDPLLGNQAARQAIRVLLVDDHAMVRQGLRSVLESYSELDVVGEARNGEEAVALVEGLRPAVVLMDINMPGMNGIDATLQIRARHPDTVVVGLSVNADGANQDAMKRAGAAVLITKEAAVDELYGAIQQAVSCRHH